MNSGTAVERVLVLCVCRGTGTGTGTGTERCWGSSTEPGAGDSPGLGTGLVPRRAPQLHPSGPSCLMEWGEEGNLPQKAVIPHLHQHPFLIFPGSAFLLPSASTLSSASRAAASLAKSCPPPASHTKGKHSSWPARHPGLCVPWGHSAVTLGACRAPGGRGSSTPRSSSSVCAEQPLPFPAARPLLPRPCDPQTSLCPHTRSFPVPRTYVQPVPWVASLSWKQLGDTHSTGLVCTWLRASGSRQRGV